MPKKPVIVLGLLTLALVMLVAAAASAQELVE